ncbi:MAG: coniferyl-alcohol dehydrogenase [Alphaproteobacteria bacterium]|jgi:NAD(P)-dependent dehydrogenase (short-subunit alcohol dehydrogenase family)|nr:coniferyl-alcohol dehydrogenase [Alphaproteobacteria bacterium]
MVLEHPILLTGGASGVGEATAKLLLERGHQVTSLDIKPSSNDGVTHHHCDLSDTASIDAAVAELPGAFSSLLNVAGVPGTVGGDLTFAVNFLGLRYLTEKIWDRIVDNGTVVSVSSIAGNNWRKRRGELAEALATETFAEGQTWWRANADTVGTDAYTFSKEAVVLYTMVLAGRGLARGIRVNDVGPGPIDTPILPDFTTEVGADTMKTMIDMVGRSAQPHDIAEAVVQLAEGHIGWLNGQHIIVDGGMMAGFSSGWNK